MTVRKFAAAAIAAALLTSSAAVAAHAATAKFADEKGKITQKIKVTSESTFPALAFDSDATFQGWSTKKGKSCGATWLEGQAIPDANATYYPVTSRISTERESGLPKEPKKHSYVYLVGDSRTAQPKRVFASKLKKTRFVAKGGQGYAWLTEKGGGYDQLLAAIKKDGKTKKKKAVVFRLGVNDLKNASRYVEFYKKVAPELKALGCDLYVESVTQFSDAQRNRYFVLNASAKKANRTEKARAKFNAALKSLSGTYAYLNSSSFLKKSGWTYKAGSGSVPDGLHYTTSTYARILEYDFGKIG